MVKLFISCGHSDYSQECDWLISARSNINRTIEKKKFFQVSSSLDTIYTLELFKTLHPCLTLTLLSLRLSFPKYLVFGANHLTRRAGALAYELKVRGNGLSS